MKGVMAEKERTPLGKISISRKVGSGFSIPTLAAAAMLGGCALGLAKKDTIEASQFPLSRCERSETTRIGSYAVCPKAFPVVEYLTAHFAGHCSLRCTITGTRNIEREYQNPIVAVGRDCFPHLKLYPGSERGSSRMVRQMQNIREEVSRVADVDEDGMVTGYEALSLERKVANAEKLICAERFGVDPEKTMFYIEPVKAAEE